MIFILFIISFVVSNVSSLDCGCPESGRNAGDDVNKKCYRTYDGSYNNLEHPLWGRARRPYARLFEDSYSYGIDGFPRSVTGEELPNPRNISLEVFPDVKVEIPPLTLVMVMWGQLIAHDMSLTQGVPQTNQGFIECCTGEGKFTENEATNPRCASIVLPKTDPYNAPEGRECINFVRTIKSDDNDTYARPNEPKTEVTSFIDLSIVYDNSKDKAYELRAFERGRLRVSYINNKYYPPTYENPGDICTVKNISKNYCFQAGDVRANQNTPLTLLQIMLLRQHNKFADELSRLNRHWSDEKCYQEARRILIAMEQHITYYEFLPIILGLQNMIDNKLYYKNQKGYVNDYDPEVNPSTYNEHATAAYRLYHSSIQGRLSLCLKDYKECGFLRLSEWMDNPSIILYKNIEQDLSRGQACQIQGKPDRFFDEEVTQFLFRVGILGQDLRAIDITRSRDHRVGSYVAALKACGNPEPKSFEDLKKYSYIRPEYVDLLSRVYKDVKDIELVVGGVLEDLLPDAISGPTYNCIMTKQFFNTRVGDRFFYESGTQPCPFTIDQLNSIRSGSSVASLFCNNIPGYDSIQKRAFKQRSENNPLVRCSSLPKINLRLWKERY